MAQPVGKLITALDLPDIIVQILLRTYVTGTRNLTAKWAHLVLIPTATCHHFMEASVTLQCDVQLF
jgi:hypothetical protein